MVNKRNIPVLVILSGAILFMFVTFTWLKGTPFQRTVYAAAAIPSPAAGSLRPTAIEEEVLYLDGMYTAIGEYENLSTSVIVTITLIDDVITGAEVIPQAKNPAILKRLHRFPETVPELIIGKRIGDVKLEPVPGLCNIHMAFNDAITKIKQQVRIGPELDQQ
ncbi:MAG: hypothetical protein K0R57_663 [Paenibacillaceae bacterium]|jgi:hypothetical protein|nr:hypothetical protein [Paenibacillaceae bacterium]